MFGLRKSEGGISHRLTAYCEGKLLDRVQIGLLRQRRPYLIFSALFDAFTTLGMKAADLALRASERKSKALKGVSYRG